MMTLEQTALAAVEKRIRAAIAKLGDKITDIEIELMIAGKLPELHQALQREQLELDGHVFHLRYSLALMHTNKHARVTEADEVALRAAQVKRRPLFDRMMEAVSRDATVTPAPRVPPQLKGRRARPRSDETVVEAIPVRAPHQLLLGPAPAPPPAVGFRKVVDAIAPRLDVTPRRRPT